MEIVFIDTTLATPPTGGAHTFLVHLSASLVRRGYAVSVVTQPGRERGVADALRAAGAEVHERLWRATDLPEERAARLAAWVNARRPDAYVVSASPDAGWLALPLLDGGIPRLSVAHNDVGAFYEPLRHYGAFVDCAVSVSEEIHRKTTAECGIPAGRARRIAYGVESLSEPEAEARAAASVSSAGEPLKIVYVGRMVEEQKRVSEMAPLAEELARRGVAFELHVIGDGEARARLAAEFAARGVAARVKLWGWLSPSGVKRRLAEADVFLLMSDYEGLSVALLEAMGRALAPVVTRIASGTGEVVEDARSGFLVPVGDIEAFADRIGLLARDRRLLASLRLAAWRASQPYTVERMADEYVKCFAEARETNARRGESARRQPDYPLMPSCVSRYPYWLRKIKRRALAAAGRVG
ncbi:MAG: glycosyltransferase family 4 protein [Acidobacteria bacterium]|nr:glycosyltransferase family 4 protein [Acidobacteriota bacterium]